MEIAERAYQTSKSHINGSTRNWLQKLWWKYKQQCDNIVIH
jgi:hypothetical protein